ncbi:MAG TPA: aminofutalosine synthase MqnE [Acidobacteria bacterium]|nr:aminofutalosine synthase MqnE [Acidobacteriota bacterium]
MSTRPSSRQDVPARTVESLGLRDPALEPVAEAVLDGRRLSREEALAAATTGDLLGLGRLANIVREQLHGTATYFNVNRHLNPTNVCAASCALCAFYVPWRRADEGWTYTVEEALRVVERDMDPSVTELHIVGGLHPRLGVEYWEELFRAIKERFPWVHIKALTMVELDFYASVSRIGLDELIERLKAAGLGSCPGGGAEIFAPRAREIICDHKVSGDRWLEVAWTVHGHGLKTNCTMLYGHVETAEERVDHLLALRELQDETGGFQCFIPLAFHPENTRLDHLPPAGGVLDLQTIAMARLVLDNVPHVKAYWVMLGEKIAQLAQLFGADDLDGTIVDERITRAAGGTAGRGMSRRRLEHLIREAGRVPVERDTLYNPVNATSGAPAA